MTECLVHSLSVRKSLLLFMDLVRKRVNVYLQETDTVHYILYAEFYNVLTRRRKHMN